MLYESHYFRIINRSSESALNGNHLKPPEKSVEINLNNCTTNFGIDDGGLAENLIDSIAIALIKSFAFKNETLFELLRQTSRLSNCDSGVCRPVDDNWLKQFELIQVNWSDWMESNFDHSINLISIVYRDALRVRKNRCPQKSIFLMSAAFFGVWFLFMILSLYSADWLRSPSCF